MTAVMLWKEYRQQRGVWLVIVFAALMMATVIYGILSNLDGWHQFQRDRPMIMNALMFLLVAIQGVITGSLLIAEEKETGTVTFLDHLSGNRNQVFWRKILAGLYLVVSQGLVMILIGLALGICSWTTALATLGFGLDGLAWGLFAGVMFRTGLTAILLGVLMNLLSWPACSVLMILPALVFKSQDNIWLPILSKVGMGIGVLYTSWHFYCRSDFTRRAAGLGKLSKLFSALPTDKQALLWLLLRQSRLILAIALPSCLVGSVMISLSPFIIWPAGTLALGLIFGLFGFSPEQPDAVRFLGSQRFPKGKIWSVKTLFWFGTLSLLVGLAWLLVSRVSGTRYFHTEYGLFFQFTEGIGFGNCALLIAIWPLYGFCFGLFFGQVTARPIIGFFLSLFFAPVIAFLWVPSLLMGGVLVWWVLSIPVILLTTSRVLMRPWLSGRLMTAMPVGVIGLGAVLIICSVCAFFWYRTVQPPDEGEPFDVAAFNTALDVAKNNEAGQMLRNANLELRKHGTLVDMEIWPQRAKDLKPNYDWRTEPRYSRLFEHSRNLLEEGWPKEDQVLERWMDRVFDGQWLRVVEKAARLPLGLLQDPRLVSSTRQRWSSDGAYQHMSELIIYRALQVQGKGDDSAALELLETAFGVARHMKNFAPVPNYHRGCDVEKSAIAGYYFWLEKVGPNKKLLQAGLAALQKHEAETPDPANTVKGEYLIAKRYEPEYGLAENTFRDLYRMAYEIPWEKKRQERIVGAIAVDRLHQLEQLRRGKTYEPPISDYKRWEYPRWIYSYSGLIYNQSWHSAIGQRNVHAAQLVTAIALYQAEHGKPPARLEELLPNYLAALPLNPFEGKVLSYRVSEGEVWQGTSTLEKGQAMIEGKSRRLGGDFGWDKFHKPVPKWSK